jgi:RimJ/RimL family protein N-acetyltransferase
MIKLKPVREMSEFQQVEDIISKFHSNPKGLWTIEDSLQRPQLNLFFIVNDWDNKDTIIGVTSYQRFSNTLAILQKHIIVPEYRGLGYGSITIELVEQDAYLKGITKLAAYVLEKNRGMIKVMHDNNFRNEGYLRNHFGPDLGCYVFGKEL